MIQAYAAAGADEIQIVAQGQSYSALRSFDFEGVRKAEQLCNEAGIALSVEMDRLFFSDETREADEWMRFLSNVCCRISFMDPGLARLAKQMHCLNEMIYTPLTLLTSDHDAAWWMAQGLYAVSVSPLLTKEETMRIVSKIPSMEVSVFGHQIMSVSRRPLLSDYAHTYHTEQMQNRKNLYLIEETRDQKMPIYESKLGTVIYTDYVLHSFAEMKAFADAGADRFMMDSVFVSDVCTLDALKGYSAVLHGADAQKEEEKFSLKHPDLLVSEGYYGKETVR